MRVEVSGECPKFNLEAVNGTAIKKILLNKFILGERIPVFMTVRY